jgi:hypothetical protein
MPTMGDSVPAELTAAAAAVLGTDVDWIRTDTPLERIGIDPLARVLLVDAAADLGVDLDPHTAWTATTWGGLLDGVRP